MSLVPKFLKNNDDEWKKWCAKKVIEHREFVSKLSKNYKDKIQRFTSKSLIKNTPKRSKEVVIKITSSSKHFQGISKHIDYISRNGNLEIITSDLEHYKGKDENLELKQTLKIYGKTVPNKNEIKREIRQTYNMVFSMKEHSSTPPDKLKQAVFTTLKQAYPDNYFAITFHDDTDNPHCHVCLKISKNDGKRIDIRKADLAHLRIEFAKNLNLLGIEATATRAREKNQSIDFAKRQQILDSLQDKSKTMIKPHYYKVLDFGKAKFNFKDEENYSFFVRYLTPKGDTIIWGKDLERVVDKLNIQKGEYVKFGKIGDKAEPYSFKKKINNKWYEVQSARKIPVWDASVAGRAEKNFTKLPPIEIIQTLKDLNTERKNNESRKRYTKQEWARYYANKRRVYKSATITNRRVEPTKSINDLRKLSQIPMVWKPSSNQMLLHSNAQHKLEYGSKRATDNAVRWANSSNNGIRKRQRQLEKS